jgi:hypothetical protein
MILRCHRAFHHNAERHLAAIFGKGWHAEQNAAVSHGLFANRIPERGVQRIISPRRGGEGQRE